MNDFIAMVLMAKLLHLDYIEKFGGIVKVTQRTTKNAEGDQITVRIPTATAFEQYQGNLKDLEERRESLNCDLKKKILKDFIPESKLLGMIYFEDNGIQVDYNRRHSSLIFYNSNIRLVAWFNQKNLKNEFDNNFRSEAMLEIINTLTTKIPVRHANLHLLSVSVDGIPSNDSSIFSNYDYNEAQTQFITAPYDFFAIDFNISFGVSKHCQVKFTPEEIICK